MFLNKKNYCEKALKNCKKQIANAAPWKKLTTRNFLYFNAAKKIAKHRIIYERVSKKLEMPIK